MIAKPRGRELSGPTSSGPVPVGEGDLGLYQVAGHAQFPIRLDSSRPDDPVGQLAEVLIAQMERTYTLERARRALTRNCRRTPGRRMYLSRPQPTPARRTRERSYEGHVATWTNVAPGARHASGRGA